MTRICYVATDAISFNVLYRGQFEYLRLSKNDLTLLCGGSSSELQRLRERDVGNVVPISMKRRPHLLSDLKALLYLIKHFEGHRYDIIVATTPKAILLGALAAKITRQPRRVIFFQGRVYENFSGFVRRFYRFLDLISAWCAHEVLFVSKSLMEEYCQDDSVYGRKGRVLGEGSVNGLCRYVFNPDSCRFRDVKKLREGVGLAPDDFVAVAVGRICVDKGLEELDLLAERASKKNKKLKFVLVGAVEEGVKVIFHRLLSRGNVIHVNFSSDVARYFSLADVHIFLTHREGFGNVAIEAAAMGVPTIAFDVVGVRDSVADGVSGRRVPFGDIEAVWTELEAMQCNRQLAAEQYVGARDWALEKFDQQRVWEVYRDFYTQS